MRRPIIAVNSTLELRAGSPNAVNVQQHYIDALIDAGGLPLIVPPRADAASDYFAAADGILFTGGRDYPPALYKEKAHESVREQTPQRTDADLALMKLAMGSPKPALGICAGLQLLNIASGGGLIQHLDKAEDHVSRGGVDASHRVSLKEGTKIAALFGAREITVNSSHHQAVDPSRLGRGLAVAGTADDGTIEALELARDDGRFFVFVQWHPERIVDKDHTRRIFGPFVAACRANPALK